MQRCAFLTTDDLVGYITDDRLAIEPLRELGWEAEEVSWRDPNQDWSRYDAVVIRSTWDYHRDLDRFLATLKRIAEQTTLHNRAGLVAWNAHKTYLRELEARGVPIVPTVWSRPPLEPRWLATQFDRLETDELVVKPQVGASAQHVYRIRRDDPPERWGPMTAAFRLRPGMVQPFLPSIQDEGEASLLFLGGEYSHAVLKRPRPGDFRVQEEHGGVIEAWSPPTSWRDRAAQVVAGLESAPLYARVDLVRRGGEPVLIELELIEPALFLRMDPQAPARLAKVIDRWSCEPRAGDG